MHPQVPIVQPYHPIYIVVCLVSNAVLVCCRNILASSPQRQAVNTVRDFTDIGGTCHRQISFPSGDFQMKDESLKKLDDIIKEIKKENIS